MLGSNLINVGRFNRGLSRLFRIADTPAPTLGGEIMPTLPFTDGVENLMLREEHPIFGGFAQAGAATPAQIFVANPALAQSPGNNTLLIIEQLIVTVNPADTVFLALSASPVSPTFQLFNRDGRWAATQSGVGFVTGGIAAPPGGVGLFQFAMLANVAIVIPVQAVLPPGVALRISCNVVATVLSIGVIGRERLAAPEELTL